MAKRIIVEGMDGTGKSTLIKNLVDRMPELESRPGFMHTRFGPSDDFAGYLKWELRDRDDWLAGQTPIHDRFLYSELIYGPMSSSTGDYRIPLADLVDYRYDLEKEAFLIWCDVPRGKVMLDKEQHPWVAAHFDEIYQGYQDLFDRDTIMRYVGSRLKNQPNRFILYRWYLDTPFYSQLDWMVKQLREYLEHN